MLAYNNVLVEEYLLQERIRKKFYLPAYYGEPYDHETYNIYGADLQYYNTETGKAYGKLGVDMVSIPVWVSLLYNEGVINCTAFETETYRSPLKPGDTVSRLLFYASLNKALK